MNARGGFLPNKKSAAGFSHGAQSQNEQETSRMSTTAPIVKADQKPASPKKTFQQLVDSDTFKAQIAAALPKHITAERFIRVLMTATLKNTQLLECTQESLFKGIFDCAALGLELDGRRAHLVPLRNNKKEGKPLEANLWVDYKGMAELVMRSGVVSNIHADIVCDHDVFEYDRGVISKHTINFKEDRGNMYAVYCLIRMKDGGEKCEVMSVHQIDRVRDSSPGKNQDPWTKHYAEMAKKTVAKRAFKWVPMSAEVAKLMEVEHEEPLNVTPRPTMAGILGDQPARQIEAPPAADPQPAIEYTAAQREEFTKAIENHMLDAGVSEKALRVDLGKAGIELDSDFALMEQTTAKLAEIAAHCAPAPTSSGGAS